MTTKARKILSHSEKQDLIAKALKILTCGDPKIVNAFTARVEELVEFVRSQKTKSAKKG